MPVNNLNHADLMKRLDRMNACHKADAWLSTNRHDLRSALTNLPLDEWSHWLFKQLRREDALDIGLPEEWINAAIDMDAQIAAETTVLYTSYIKNNRQPNRTGYNAALDLMKRRLHREYLLRLISTIVDESDTL